MRHPDIVELVRRDGRYAYEAYEFIFSALDHTQKLLGRKPADSTEIAQANHVTGREIVMGAIDFAREEFGMLAKLVFHQWGVRQTDDLGELVFNLIESNLLSKTENDQRQDFHAVCDLDRMLTEGQTIRWEGKLAQRGVR